MGNSIYRVRYAFLLGTLCALLGAAPATAAELAPYELDPQLSLTGDCSTSAFDPVPDPSCEGEPPTYPAPPNGPSGRFNEPRAVAIDSFGNEYVASYDDSEATGRIDVFDDEGKFVTEVAAPNAKNITVDSDGELYVYEDDGKIVRYPASEYDSETGDIAYDILPVTVATGGFFGSLAIDPSNDQLFVARGGAITRYASAEAGSGVIESFEPEGIGTWTEAMAIDAQRDRIYVSFCPNGGTTGCGVKVLAADPPHTLLGTIDGSTTPATQFAANFARMGLAVDEETGDFFIADIPSVKTVYQYNEDFEYLAQFKANEFLANISIQIAVSNGDRSLSAEPCEYPDSEDQEVAPGDACNRHYLFIPVLKDQGRVAAYHPPGQTPPVIEEVATGGIGKTEAELRATIFPGGVDTEYRFEITSQEAFEVEEFAGATIVREGSISSESLATEVSAFATGLTPGQTYRFRVVAENELGPAPEEGQNEATFTTYDDVQVPGICPNQELRVGPSLRLPDCRAYELVTPPDTNGRPPKGVGFVGERFATVEASPAGDAVWFKIEGGSLPGSSGVGSFEGDPYLATRGGSGWTTDLAGATGEEATVSIPGSSSPDQRYSFWSARIEGPLVINGEETQYLRYPDGHSELIGRGNEGQTDPKARGRLITENATHVIFETFNSSSTSAVQLAPNAPPTGTPAVYDRTINPVTGAEETHVVSLLPGDITPTVGANESYVGASKDGEGIAFELSNTLYLRVGNQTTYEVGENVEFAGVSAGGERIFYVEGGDLLALDTTSGSPTGEVSEFSTTGNVTPVNVATGGDRAYFVSPSVLGGINPEGDSAQPGEQNLYLSEEGEISFVATVTDRDVEGEEQNGSQFDGLGLWTEVLTRTPALDPARTNPGGSVLLFQSRAEITGYEESDFAQIYRFDSGEGRLHCISCISTGTPATGGAGLQTITFDSLDPPPLGPSGFVPNLTPDGKRVFFESTEALVSIDTDEVQDVYEWEEEGVGSCDRPGGCVYLISSGQSARDNFLYAHSTSGDDVFFTTEDSLTGFDSEGGVSIYDAKVGGGFPEPVEGECVADGCRPSVSPAPVLPAPGRPAPGADDQFQPERKPRVCPKGKRKVKKNGKVRCVKKKKQGKAGKRGKANKNRGAAG